VKNVCPFVGMMAAKNTALEILDGPNLSITKEMLPPPILWPNKMTCRSMVERRSVRGWVYCSILVMSSAIALLMPLELRSTAVALNPAAFKSVTTSKKNHAPPPIPCTSTTCCPAAVLATLELGLLISSGVVLVLVATAADEPGSKVAVKQQPTTNRSTLV
jgi:hypothetical protein